MEVDKFVSMFKSTDTSLFFGYATVGIVENGKATIKFDGNDSYTSKYYNIMNKAIIKKDDRVLVLGKNKNDLLIVGRLSGSADDTLALDETVEGLINKINDLIAEYGWMDSTVSDMDKTLNDMDNRLNDLNNAMMGLGITSTNYTVEFGEIVGNGTIFFTRPYTDRPYFHINISDNSVVDVELKYTVDTDGTKLYNGAKISGANDGAISLLVFYCTLSKI